MKTAKQLLDSAASDLSNSTIYLLADIARSQPAALVVVSRTSRMAGDLVGICQDPTVSIHYVDTAAPCDEFWVCDDAGHHGGPVTHSVDGNSWVSAEYIDGVHRLAVGSGELVDPEVLL